jgi:predicted MPP superfamily phosphohydrolase
MKRRSFLKTIAMSCSAALGVFYLDFDNSAISISKKTLPVAGLGNKLRVVAVSDVHLPGFSLSETKLIDIINSYHPDVFVLAGDIVDSQGNEFLVENFGAVEASQAKVATLGNWEYLSGLNLQKLEASYREAGIRLLVNAAVDLDSLTIFGFDDWFKGRADQDALQRSASAERPVLIISHCPVIFDNLPGELTTPAVALCGHTHGGQIAPFGIAFVTPEGSGSYVSGWYYRRGNAMYVMKGLGTTPGCPIRIGAKPEILVLDIAAI